MKKIVKTNKAPEPVGPYNQAVIHNNTMYISGQIALDPYTKELVINDLKKETMLVMNNLKAILENENLSFENVIKSTIFLCDMGNFKEVNEIYGSFFNKGNEPARETVEVSKLPLGVNVEISMIAGL
ncbi:MAG: Rid family detoxifying hydrolase [Flavobacteriaceae bacterium]|nr:reactive intermediate/imine deaminase [Flavobacteriaceae bacterium]|tara:strand:- start:1708 stop:2088 length:381 start_codon:yes stop_codon:yes gene_type:complete